MVKPNSIGGEKKDPNTAILLLQAWLTVTDTANYETSWVFIVGLCWSAQSSFCVLFSLCPTSFPSLKSPVGLYYPLRILSVPKHTRGIAKMFRSGWFNSLVFVANNVSGAMPFRHPSAADGKDRQKIDRIWINGYLLWAVYCSQLHCWLSGKSLYSVKLKPYFSFLF